MKPVTVSTVIAADPGRVFDVIVDIERFPETSPATVAVVFLSDQKLGAGTRFRETRRMGKTTRDFDLELKECDRQRRRARFISEMHGTVWDTSVEVLKEREAARVTFTMAAHTSFFQGLLFAFMRSMFRRAMTEQVDALRNYCEG